MPKPCFTTVSTVSASHTPLATRAIASRLSACCRRFPLHHLHQRNQMRWVPEVRAEHAPAVPHPCRDLANRYRRGVAGEHRVGFGEVVERGEDVLLDLEPLGARLDNKARAVDCRLEARVQAD